MTPAPLSTHFENRTPSAIRQAQILFAERADRDSVEVVNLSTGNVSLPMHPLMQARMRNLGAPGSPFADGVVKYSASVGLDETRAAFLNILASADIDTDGLHCGVTDGGSQAMELMILGVCGPVAERPLMLMDPSYTNYMDIARRCGTPTVSLRRALGGDGNFSLPDPVELRAAIEAHRPSGLLIIPADNPTGQFMTQAAIADVARICVEHDMWIVSDEAYRQLHYVDEEVSSIWKLTEEEVPGITGRRISIETASKVWNACGLRIGALITDSAPFHRKAVAEYTANLCANVIGQYIFGALAEASKEELQGWYAQQRGYYTEMMSRVSDELRAAVPGLIVSNPDAALYTVVDVRDCVWEDFDALDFVAFCASEGRVEVNGVDRTLLCAPMGGFYGADKSGSRYQMRLAFVEPTERVVGIGALFAGLLEAYATRAT